MRYVTAILLAAGEGVRFGDAVPKALAKINSQPVIIFCLKTLSLHPYIRDIVVVANPRNKEAIASNIDRYRITKIRGIVTGGLRRQDSVRNGLRALDTNTDLVLVHDGVRPFIDRNTVSSVIKEADRSGAAIVGVPVKATIKQVTRSQGHKVTRSLERESLWEIQTPQVFRKDLILKAYKKFGDLSVTDDSMLVEKLGAKVSVVLGSYSNIKITTPEDLVLAQAIAKELKGEG